MDASTPNQVFLLTADNEVWGPLTVATLKLFIENEAITGTVEVSLDGKSFNAPGAFPAIRHLFPKKMWGDYQAPSMQVMEIPARGDLSQVSSIRLYALAAAQNRNGLLQLFLPDRHISIHFRKGNPEAIESNHSDDALGTFLLKAGLLSGEQLTRTEAAKNSFGGDLLAALFGLGMLNPSLVLTQLAVRAKGILFHAIAAMTGSFTFDDLELPPHKALPLGDRWEVLTEQVRRLPALALEPRLSPLRHSTPVKSSSLVEPTELKLNPHEVKAWAMFDGVRTLDKILSDVASDIEPILRMALLLKELGALSFGEETIVVETAPASKPAFSMPKMVPPVSQTATPAKVIPTSVAPPSVAPVVPASKPAEKPIGAEEIEKLRAFKEKLLAQNHFEVLGVAPTADNNTIKVSYFKLAKLYHPDTVPPSAPPEFAALKASIFSRVGESYRVLSDPRTRAEYQDELAAGVNAHLDLAQVLAAEEAFQKASILVKNRKFPEAVALLEDALKANPAEGEFYIWRGYARFFTFKDKKQGKEEAFKDIQHGLSLNERCVAGYYFQGVILRLVGDLAGAKKLFQKCLQMQPEHLEAQRELRALR